MRFCSRHHMHCLKCSAELCFDCFHNLSTCSQCGADAETMRGPHTCIEPLPESDDVPFDGFSSDGDAWEKEMQQDQPRKIIDDAEPIEEPVGFEVS